MPDPAAVGQYLADAAAQMARRGWRVVVLTANRGYDDPSVKYARRETIDGVEVRRLPFSSFGKRSILIRLLGGVVFVCQAVLRGLFTRGLSCVLVSTSPPMCPMAAVVIGRLRRVPIKYWAMDLNPDQMIALGRVSERSVFVKLFEWQNRLVLSRAADVVALDRFMAQRLVKKLPSAESKISVLPPWPIQEHLEPIDHEHNPFRKEHGLEGKFVVMYSGNLSIASPVDTVLQAALRLQEERDLVFMFIGGGLGKKSVDDLIREHRPSNVVSLPYEPLERIRYSLSAADVHLVAVGEAIVGICHPCKVYGAMAVGRPLLLLGPDPCHVSDIITSHNIGWHISHGDVDAAVETIRRIAQTDRTELATMGAAAKGLVADRFSHAVLSSNFCSVLEKRG